MSFALFVKVLNYVKHEDLLSGNVDAHSDAGCGGTSDKMDAFDYCWNQSKLPRTPAKPIPGHPKAKSGAGSSGPKSPKSPRSPHGLVSGSKSPRTPPNSLAAMTDEDLKRLKEELLRQKLEAGVDQQLPDARLPRKESQVKFNLDGEEEN